MEILMKRKLNLALWIAAGILAVVFLVSSSTKLFVPKEKLAGMGGAASRWVDDFRPRALKAIGALEFLAAAGLIVPAALGIAPILVPLAASGAVLLFTGAVIMRLRRGERVWNRRSARTSAWRRSQTKAVQMWESCARGVHAGRRRSGRNRR
jgi:hypothetical protein